MVKFIFKLIKTSRTKRSNNGVPFELYVETMVVTDKSIFDDHKRFAQTDDNAKVFLHMKAYFAHFMNGVSVTK